MAYAAVAVEALATVRTVFEIFRLRDDSGNFPPSLDAWIAVAVFAALCTAASAIFVIGRRNRPAIFVAVFCVIAMIIYKYAALPE